MATILISWAAPITRLTAPPRAVYTRLNRGATLGRPHDVTQQRRVLLAALGLLAQDAPAVLVMDERA